MKRSASFFVCICLLLAMSAGSVWAEWEGNAGMASASDFPQSGMYARSDMFPKNTVVEIRNLETEITVRAIITGTAGVPGLVAVLSPGTASALQIRTGSVSRVRISVPSPVSERPAPGTVSTGTALETADPDINPAAATATAAVTAATVPAAASAPAVASVPAVTSETVPAPIPLSSLANTAADPLVPLSEPSPEVAPEPVPATSPVPAAAAVFAAPEPAAPEPAVVPETVAVPDPAPAPEVIVAAEPAPAPAPAIEAAPAVSTIFIEEPVLEEPAPVIDAPDVAVAADSTPDVAVAAEPAAAEADVSADLISAALIPAEPNPPAPSEVPAVPVAPAIPAVAAVSPVVPAAVAPAAVPSVQVLALPYISTFAKGGYYVQIASYTDPVNAQKLVDSYGKKYPVAVERAPAKGGEVLKVFIGPVKKDEYGAVLERFKSLGFKDAFVKKGQ